MQIVYLSLAGLLLLVFVAGEWVLYRRLLRATRGLESALRQGQQCRQDLQALSNQVLIVFVALRELSEALGEEALGADAARRLKSRLAELDVERKVS